MLTEQDLDRLAELLAKATPGEWTADRVGPATNTSWDYVLYNRDAIRTCIGPDKEALFGVYGRAPWEADETADAHTQLVLLLHKHAPAIIALARANLARPWAGTTADGVEVRVGDRVWRACSNGERRDTRCYASPQGHTSHDNGEGITFQGLGWAYSTPEAAALAAAGASTNG